MKKLFTFLGSLLTLAAHAQTAPTWTSAVGLPVAPAFRLPPSYAVDAAGNTYLAGSFGTSVTLAPGTVLTTTSPFDQDGVVAKYSPTGALLWYRQLTGPDIEGFSKVVVEASGKVTLMGTASDGAQLGNTTFSSSNFLPSLVLAQLDAQGQVQYLREVGQVNSLTPASLAADAAGNLYVSGTFAMDATFGSFALTTPFDSNTGATGYDQFVVKVSATGTVLWAQQGGRQTLVPGFSISFPLSQLVAMPGGGVYFVWTSLPSTGGFGTLTMPASKGDYDGLVVKFDSQGTPQWEQRVGGPNGDVPTVAALDASGRLVVPVIIAPAGALANPGTGIVVSTGSLAVLEPVAGALVWSRELLSTQSAGYQSVVSDAAGNLYVAGAFTGQATLPGKTLTSAGGTDVLLASYSPTGTLRWTQQSTGAGDESPAAIAFDHSGNLVLVGNLTGNGQFGSASVVSASTTTGLYTPFVAYLNNVALATRTGQAAALLSLYPNPATTAVQLPALPAGTQLTLLDALGRVTRREAAGATLVLAGLAPGLYVVQAAAPSGEQWQSRLVVE